MSDFIPHAGAYQTPRGTGAWKLGVSFVSAGPPLSECRGSVAHVLAALNGDRSPVWCPCGDSSCGGGLAGMVVESDASMITWTIGKQRLRFFRLPMLASVDELLQACGDIVGAFGGHGLEFHCAADKALVGGPHPVLPQGTPGAAAFAREIENGERRRAGEPIDTLTFQTESQDGWHGPSGRCVVYSLLAATGGRTVALAECSSLAVMAKMARADGNYLPFMCTCGDTGCGGYGDGVDSTVGERTIEWFMRDDSGRRRVFDRAQFEDAVTRAIADTQRILAESPDIDFLDYETAVMFGRAEPLK